MIVQPGLCRKPGHWFSHDAAQMFVFLVEVDEPLCTVLAAQFPHQDSLARDVSFDDVSP